MHTSLRRLENKLKGEASLQKSKMALILAKSNVWIMRTVLVFVMFGLVLGHLVSESTEGWIYLAVTFGLWLLSEIVFNTWVEKTLAKIAKKTLQRSIADVFKEVIWLRLGCLSNITFAQSILSDASKPAVFYHPNKKDKSKTKKQK